MTTSEPENEDALSKFNSNATTHLGELAPKSSIKNPKTSSVQFESYGVLQSRFFLHDLIKITSRKSTTKIITFYYRIPKLKDYQPELLEKHYLEATLTSP